MPDVNSYPDFFTDPENLLWSRALELVRLTGPPVITTDRLYNVGGTLYWNGSVVGGGTSLWELEGGVGPNIYYNAGNVGIGTNTPLYQLDINGQSRFSDDIIIANNKNINFQDSLGGLTSNIIRQTTDELEISVSSAGKDIELLTNGGVVRLTGGLSVSAFNATGYLWNDGSGNVTGGYTGGAGIANFNDRIVTTVGDGTVQVGAGIAAWIEVPFEGTITKVTSLADTTGSIQVDIWKDTYANYPPTSSDSITSASPPSITNGIKNQDSTLSGWIKTISAGDILMFNVATCTDIRKCVFTLTIQRST